MNIKFTADSTIDLSADLIKKYKVEIIPLTVILGEVEHKDGVDIHPQDIVDFVEKTGLLPKTAAANYGQFDEAFDRLTKNGDSVIHFSISADMSASYSNALKAAEKYNNVFVVNSQSLSTGNATLLAYAYDLAQKNLDAQTIYDRVVSVIPYVQASFILDNLKFLHKGGRCSSLALLGANLLKIKPCIAVKNGTLQMERKYWGNFTKVAKDYVLDTLKEHNHYEPSICFITHTETDPVILETVRETLRANSNFREIIETEAGCTVTSHCGKNTIGILFIDAKLEY